MDEGRLKDVAVIGAAGKMGRGIALLLLQERALSQKGFILRLIDQDENSLQLSLSYLRDQLTRFAEKKIVLLRKVYSSHPKLVSNQEIITYFVQAALQRVQWGKELALCRTSELVFEAIVEDIQAKVSLFHSLEALTAVKPYYFSNTSSIPIAFLSKKAGIDGRLIGFHFYNPPAVQHLLEIIAPSDIDPNLITLANQLASRLEKKVVVSKDVAGFIGNGLFLREISFAQELADKKAEEIVRIDFVTEKYLLRPMGIFSLVDYVGIDVVCKIAAIMRKFLSIELPLGLIERLQSHGILGGVNPDGSRRSGIFAYEAGVPVAVFDLKTLAYIPIDPSWKESFTETSWKSLLKASDREEKMKNHFHTLSSMDTPEARLAQKFIAHGQQIADELVRTAVAESMEDVETVLKEGFYHLAGLKVCV